MSDNHGAEIAGDDNHQESNGSDSFQDEILINQVAGKIEMNPVDSKEDMFVDAMDDLNSQANTETENETEIEEEVSSSISVQNPNLQENGSPHYHKEEGETFAREIARFRYQLKALTEQRNNGGLVVEVDLVGNEEVGDSEENDLGNDVALRDVINDCSKYLKSAMEERLHTESTIRELNAILYMKDQEIEDLTSTVTELSVSRDVAASYMNSVQNDGSQSAEELSEVQLEKDRQIEVVADRILANLGMVVYQEELLDSSVVGKIAHVEKNSYLLIERYNWMLYEIDQLRLCLSKVEADLRVQEQFGTVFAAARDELLELKTRDVELVEKLSHLEDENRKLVEQVEKEKVQVETANAELGKTKMELEHEKTRCANTKEKLSMAVTKGKALVQQRDSLKQSLAEKTSVLEKYLTELQEKSSALEAAELCKGELVKCESLAASLQETLSQRDAILEKCGEILSLTSLHEELQSADIIEKLKWLVDERNVMAGCKEELGKWENLAASLQEMLSQKNAILENFEEILSQTSVPEELQSRDIIEKLNWLADERNALAGCKEDLVNWENLVSSLQEMISQRNAILKNFEEILSQTSVPEELQSTDIIDKLKWLVNETHVLKNISQEFDKLKNAISLVDLPDIVSSSDFESRVGWLKESYDQAKDEIKMLQDEIARTNEAAHDEIGRLSTSLSAEVQEKDYLKEELGDLMCKYNEAVEKEHHVTLEKDQMVSMLLEGCGITTEDQEGLYHTSSDLAVLFDKCIKERTSASIETPCVDAELFERIQSLLYVKDQELMLCEALLEEEVLVRLQVNDLSNELRAASQELVTLKEEKGCLQKDLERSEEKSALLREKLSMAIKKGKGLVQDRENIKQQLGEKNSEIEKLRLELQQQESIVTECRDQINRLSADLDQILKLEADLIAVKDQRDQLQQFLLESNNMLQSVIESIDGIVLPVDSVFQEPAEKVNWLAGYISECQNAKTQAEQELGKYREEASNLAVKLAEAQATMKSLEDALSVEENNISQLAEEKKKIEVDKANVEQELQEAIEAAHSQTTKVAEAFASRKSLEDALSLAENNISVLINEKEEARASRDATETELEKLREEVAIQTSKLTEAYKMIKSLEDALSQVETNVALLTDQNNDVHVGRTNLENELKKLKDETVSQASQLENASTTIKSLEDALSKAENDISVLEGEKAIAEKEVSDLNSKLNACMEELAGTSGSLESRSVELMGHLNDFQMLLKDESLLSILKKCFEKKFESLKEMDLILNGIKDHFVDAGSEALQNHPVMEDDFHVTKPFSDDLDNVVNVVNVVMENGEVNADCVDNISSCFRKTLEGFQMRNRTLAAKFEGFSTFTDGFIGALLRKLQTTRDEVVSVFENMESLKQRVKNMEIVKQEQEKAITMLENDVGVLQSACTDTTRQLQFEVKNNLLELSSVPELGNLNHGLFSEVIEVNGDNTAEHQQSPEDSKYVKTAEKLLFASRKVQNLTKLFESTSNVAAATIQDLQKNLKDTRAAFEKAIEERDLNENRVSQLEADVEALQNSCRELRLKVGGYQDQVEKLKEKEAELSSLYNNLSKKEQEAEDSLMSVSQVKTLFDKISGIEIPFAEQKVGELEPHGSAHVKKLFYIIDSVTELQHQINLLSHDKEELQSTLSAKILEIEHLKEEVETQIRNKPESEKMKDEFLELAFGLEKIIDMLGGNEFVGDQKSAGMKGLLAVVEKQVMALLLEVENSKSKEHELGTKLLGSQQVVDELSTKVKLLDDSLQGRTTQPEIVQERSIFEAPSLPTGSEISEIEDAGSLGKNSISPVPTAAHVRTMRKGSSDHLAINIDSESTHLINNEETDEDKGHVFKSLNTSGLVPKQGKLMADRIDGIWVSGGRVLMSRPRARIGLIAYWLVLHLWLLGTIL